MTRINGRNYDGSIGSAIDFYLNTNTSLNSAAAEREKQQYYSYLGNAYNRMNAQWYQNTGSRSTRRTIVNPETSYEGHSYGSQLNQNVSNYAENTAYGNFSRGLYKDFGRIDRYL